MKHKTASLSTIVMTLLVFVLMPGALVYVADPFQIYHKSYFKGAGYSTEQAYQHAGWINTLLNDPAENYEAILLGPSTTANYTQTLINQHMPWGNTMNLSINGSSPMTQAAVARYALQKNPAIKHILWDIHMFFIFPADDDGYKPPNEFPYYLYNNTLLDDKKYLFNASNLESSFRFLFGDFTHFSAGVEDNGPFYLDLLSQGRFSSFASPENMKDVLLPQIVDGLRELPSEAEMRAYPYPSIDKNLLEVIMPLCNSDKDITLIFSPEARFSYTTVWFGFAYQKIGMRRYIVEKTQSCKNIRVFAFDNQDWITTNLHNYADLFHYTIDVNHYIADSIAKNKNRLTTENIRQYEEQFIDNINSYKSLLLSQLE